jgi:SAM-dependent methyltransferase
MRRRLIAALLALGCAVPAAAQDEVPFVVTPDRVTAAMLDLAGLKPGERLVDLGSGDGRIVIAAARRGATALGVEIVPELVEQSRRAAAAAGVAARARFEARDLFEVGLAGFDVVTMYLLPEVNRQLRPRLLALAPGTRVVSHDWDMGDWEPERSVTLEVPDKPIGRDRRSTLHLWVVPARLQGLWCAPGGHSLRVTQRFQAASVEVRAAITPGPLMVFDGRATPDGLHEGREPAAARVQLALRDGVLLLQRALGPAASLPPGLRFAPAGPAGCR